MGLDRITSLTGPPVVGRFYVVPTVNYPWLRAKVAQPWPVFMTKHEDGEHLDFPYEHYHVDPRFLTSAEFDRAARYTGDSDAYSVCQNFPLQRADWRAGVRGSVPHPPVVWTRRRCARAEIPYRFTQTIARRLGPAFDGRQCKRARTGWVCPHKHVALGSIMPVDGVITCPLHGLQISADTGIVVGPRPTLPGARP